MNVPVSGRACGQGAAPARRRRPGTGASTHSSINFHISACRFFAFLELCVLADVLAWAPLRCRPCPLCSVGLQYNLRIAHIAAPDGMQQERLRTWVCSTS